jgi:N-(5-amino-5-carboxypentanoyl)-L-cysteinyl-D-valine synthase
MYPLALETDPEDLERSVLATKEACRRVPHNGIGYGALFGRYGGERAPLAPVSFNYLGRFTDGAGQPPGRPTGWQLDSAMSGSHISDRNRGADQFGIDVTVRCAGDHLVTVVDSRLDETTTRRFTSELRLALERLAAHTATVSRSGASRTRPGPQPVTGDDFEPYILVGEEHAERTLFVLPPGEGGAESYLGNLAQRLPGHRLVLFNNVHLHTPMESFEAVARYYLEHIRKLQPAGPYHLLGWSFGGIVALEASAQMARAGEKIENLFVIDSYFNMRHATARIGLPGVEDLLDPINYHYTPSREDLDRLDAQLGRLVMFKAQEPNEIVRDDQQHRLFEFYRGTPYNALDTLLPAESIEVHPLRGETHHSWVRNERLVTDMCELIAASLRDA